MADDLEGDAEDTDVEDVLEDDGVLEPADTLDGDDLGADVLDTGVDAGDAYRGSTRYGTTLAEQERGEGLDALLAEEEPDAEDDPVWTDEDRPDDIGRTTQPRAGRLLFTDDEGAPGSEADLVATDVGVDGGAASAEEAAVHLTDEPPFRSS